MRLLVLYEDAHCHVSCSFINVCPRGHSSWKASSEVQRRHFLDSRRLDLMGGEGIVKRLDHGDSLHGPLEADLLCVNGQCAFQGP